MVERYRREILDAVATCAIRDRRRARRIDAFFIYDQTKSDLSEDEALIQLTAGQRYPFLDTATLRKKT